MSEAAYLEDVERSSCKPTRTPCCGRGYAIWAADRPRRVFRNAYAVHEAI
jgi:hypothetical protein